MTIMCDVGTNSARFFRPWNSAEDASCAKLVAVQDGVKCEPKEEEEEEDEEEDEEDEEENSLSSSSCDRNAGSIVSDVSEFSEVSEELQNEEHVSGRKNSYERRHLDLLSEFVNQTHVPLTNSSTNSKLNSKCKNGTCDQPETTNLGLAMSYCQAGRPRYDFLGSTLGPSAFSPVPVLKTVDPVYFPDIQNYMPPLCYKPGVMNAHDSLINHYATVEDAVKFIHQQDMAAKQMKKLRPKKFRCEHCDVAFSNNGQLKGHVRIHTGERPFKCDTEGCGKSFTRNEELTRHKRIHTGVRPHACSICGKCFGRKDHLKKHTRTHENRGPYAFAASALGPFVPAFSYIPPPLPGTYAYPVI